MGTLILKSSVSPVVNNPDGITAATTTLFTRDFDTENAAHVIENTSVVLHDWDASYGYGGTGGWRLQPNPINGTASNEDSGGMDFYHPLGGANTLRVFSFMQKMSSAFISAIPTGTYWASVNKAIDLGGGGSGYDRGGFHFGLQSGSGSSVCTWHITQGGAGPYYASSEDWNDYGDVWTWLAFVMDARDASSANRYMAIYMKAEGIDTSVRRIARVYESTGLPNWSGGIPGIVLTPIWGYWDDMRDRELVSANLSSMFLYLDRFRVTDGWPTGADGPPF